MNVQFFTTKGHLNYNSLNRKNHIKSYNWFILSK